MTLLETAQALWREGEEADDMGVFEVWFEALSLEDKKELLVQSYITSLKILEQMMRGVK